MFLFRSALRSDTDHPTKRAKRLVSLRQESETLMGEASEDGMGIFVCGRDQEAVSRSDVLKPMPLSISLIVSVLIGMKIHSYSHTRLVKV